MKHLEIVSSYYLVVHLTPLRSTIHWSLIVTIILKNWCLELGVHLGPATMTLQMDVLLKIIYKF